VVEARQTAEVEMEAADDPNGMSHRGGSVVRTYRQYLSGGWSHVGWQRWR
jgi:hypothetical protein